MNNSKSTKRALLMSVISLFLCFAMLIGTTYAWFTDSAVSADNKITAGTLNVELYKWTSATESTNISTNSDPVFDADIKWEPGYTEVVYLSIKNEGSLALKYKVAIDVKQVSTHNLADVMEYTVTPDAKYGDVTSWAGNGTKIENAPGINETAYQDIILDPGAEHFFALSIHMLETAGNEYQNETIVFDIKVLAGQATVESDAFDETYDTFAGYPGKGYTAPITGNQTAAEVRVTDDAGYKVGSIVIPKDAADPNNTEGFTAEITKSDYVGNFTIAAGMTVTKYDVTVTGLKEDNTAPVKVELRIPAGLDPATVKLYHYSDEITNFTYNPTDGYLTFETATFSPFTIVYDADSKYTPPTVDTNNYPTATVTYEAQYVGADKITWGNYGQWSPTEGLDSNLEAAFTFACPDYDNASAELKAIIDAYRYWHCDFYVSLDKDLGANEIFLGGNYGDFGWVGFHNGELTLDANEEVGLLESVTSNPWTYADVENYVGTFTCGVGDVNNALEGATFTVKLRLTNPANAAEFVDVNVVTYTFGGDYVIQ